MSKILGIHQILVHPGTNLDGFRQFIKNELSQMYEPWKITLLKGDRGEKVGKYAIMFEIGSIEDRSRLSPAPHTSSEEDKKWKADHRDLVEALMQKWDKFSSTDIQTHTEYTDYIVLE
jgi:hypothetical protein